MLPMGASSVALVDLALHKASWDVLGVDPNLLMARGALAAAGGQPLRSWRLWQECDGFEALTAEEAAPSASQPVATPLRGAFQDCCSIDLRL
jgi:hypothetical protein